MWRKGDQPVEGYTLVKRIGKGTFGEVWQANGPGNVLVALKLIGLHEAQGLKEYRGIQRVKHIRSNNLMPFIGIWVLDQDNRVLSESALEELAAHREAPGLNLRATLTIDHAYPATLVVAMPLGEKTLWDRFHELKDQGQSFPLDELLRYMEDAARGIDYLNEPRHTLDGEAGVAIQHCDVKPANIMLVGDGAQVCDFGLAHVLAGDVARMTSAGQALGTIAYMSPECALGGPTNTSDQYSLAITYCEMRTGSLPFSDEDRRSVNKVLDAHAKGRLDLSRLSPSEREVILRATSLNPAARYPSSLEMVRELHRALRNESLRGNSLSESSVATAPRLEPMPQEGSKPRRDTQQVVSQETLPTPRSEPHPPEARDAAARRRDERQGKAERETDIVAPPPSRWLQRAIWVVTVTTVGGVAATLIAVGDQDNWVGLWMRRAAAVIWPEDLPQPLHHASETSPQPEVVQAQVGEEATGTGSSRASEEAQNEIPGAVPSVPPIASEPQESARDSGAADAKAALRGRLAQADALREQRRLAEARRFLDDASHAIADEVDARPIAATRLLIDLADPEIDHGTALRQLAESRLTSDFPRLDEIAMALAARLEDRRATLDDVNRGFALVKSWGGAEGSSRPTPIHRLVAQRVLLRLQAGPGSASVEDYYRTLRDDCEMLRQGNALAAAQQPVVAGAWIESQLMVSPTSLSNADWIEIRRAAETLLRPAEARWEAALPHYREFVLGLVEYYDPDTPHRDRAAEQTYQAFLTPAGWHSEGRKAQAGEMLTAGAALDLEIENVDAATLARPFAAERASAPRRYLELALQLTPSPPPSLRAMLALARFSDGNRTPEQVLEIADAIPLRDRSIPLLLASAASHGERLGRDPASAFSAVTTYALILQRLNAFAQPHPRVSDRDLYEQVIRPGLDVATRANLQPGQISGEPPRVMALQQALGDLWGMKGVTIRRQWLEEEGQTPVEAAYEAFRVANKHIVRAEYLVGQGEMARHQERRPRQERAKEMKELAGKALASAPAYHGGHGLLAQAFVLERLVAASERRASLFSEAIRAFDDALKRQPPEADRAEYLTVRSAARLHRAFYEAAGRADDLRDAVSDAETAAKIDDYASKEEAYCALGNALEDQAYYLNLPAQDQIAKYAAALRAFEEATRAARQRPWFLLGKSFLNLGRCEWRYAASDVVSAAKRRELLKLANSHLREALGHLQDPADQAQANHWLAEVLGLLAEESGTMDPTTLAEANVCIAKAVELAKDADPAFWAKYRAVSARLAGVAAREAKPAADVQRLRDAMDELIAAAEEKPPARPVTSEELAEAAKYYVEPETIAAKEEKLAMLDRCVRVASSQPAGDRQFLADLLLLRAELLVNVFGESHSQPARMDVNAALQVIGNLNNRERVPREKRAYAIAGNSQLNDRDFARAFEAFDRCVQLDPQDDELKYNAALSRYLFVNKTRTPGGSLSAEQRRLLEEALALYRGVKGRKEASAKQAIQGITFLLGPAPKKSAPQTPKE